jgi:hypothetical protein
LKAHQKVMNALVSTPLAKRMPAIPPKNFSGWMSRIARKMMGIEFVAYLTMLLATRDLPCSRTPRTFSGTSTMRTPLLKRSMKHSCV